MRPALDFNNLKVFVAVVERESFVGASKLLEMPTSNVSRCISQLEEKLDLQLIERSTRHMKVTQAGQLLYTRAKPLLEALEQTETELTLRQIQLKGPLRICIPTEIGPIARFCYCRIRLPVSRLRNKLCHKFVGF